MLITILLFHSDKPGFAFAICWLAFYMIASLRYSAFRCPRCGHGFFARYLFGYDLRAKKCLHCDLPKNEGEETPAP